MKSMKPGRLLAIPVIAAGIATAVFAYTGVRAPAQPAPVPAAANDIQTTNTMTVTIDQAKLSILPDWLRNCLDPTNTKLSGEASSQQRSGNPLDPSNWPNPFDPNNWQLPDCSSLVGNLQVPDWLDPNNIADSVQQHIDPGDWQQAQQLLQEAKQIPAHPDTIAKFLADAWSQISKNKWLLVVILVVIGVLVIHAVASGAKSSKGKGLKGYTFNRVDNDAKGGHVGDHARPCQYFVRNPGATESTTYLNDIEAEKYVNRAIQRLSNDISSWLQKAGAEYRKSGSFAGIDPLDRPMDFGTETTGYKVKKSDCQGGSLATNLANLEKLHKVRIVLQFDPRVDPPGFFVLTSYPIP